MVKRAICSCHSALSEAGSDDAGLTFRATIPLDPAPFAGGYNMRGAIALPDGRLLLPLCDIPAYERVYILHSADRSATWTPPIPAVASRPSTMRRTPAA